jgi:FlaA1/EpsC-like NDP-sugar epimerase
MSTSTNSVHIVPQLLLRYRPSCPSAAQMAFCVADLCDSDCMADFLSECRPQLIFHAASYKHVPMMESNAQEVIRNNVP